MTKYNDHPLKDLQKRADKIVRGNALIFFKWTCKACGERITAETPNVIYTSGEHADCEVEPGFVTNTEETGGNYLLMQAGSPEGLAFLRDQFEAPETLEVRAGVSVLDGSLRDNALRNL